jgi:predicted ATPase
MALSNEVRRLERSWTNEAAWPKRLEWIEISGLRGWIGQRIEFQFPIVAISGENGSGKSSIIQAAASVYRESTPKIGKYYASEFFPSTTWDTIEDASIKFSAQEGDRRTESSIRKKTERWKGNAQRPARPVLYFDLSRVLPVGGRVGYARIAKSKHKELTASSLPFDQTRLDRLSYILNHKYVAARMALTDVDAARRVPILQRKATGYSGYHQGQGETTITELLQTDHPKYGLILIDEIESSLHPRAQRRLIRDLANVARERELQIILTTHSPYILEELPEKARMQIFWNDEDRKIMTGVSAQFAMSKMDDAPHPDCEVYVEDEVSKTLLTEILSLRSRDLMARIQIYPFGAASVGYQLGQMVESKRFPRATAVFLDGDCTAAVGCHVLPGIDAPERAVFGGLRTTGWRDVWTRVKRSMSDVAAACDAAMNLGHHHDWIQYAAKQLALTPNVLWHAMCGEWAERCVSEPEVKAIERYLEDRLLEYA